MEARVKDAVKHIERFPDAKVATVAREFGVPRGRFRYRLQGRPAKIGQKSKTTRLSPPEEAALCRYIDRLDAVNLAVRVESDAPIVGPNWTSRFLKRHGYFKKRQKKLHAERQVSEDLTRVNQYFQRLQQVIQDNGIPPEDIWNMDETGFRIGGIRHCDRLDRINLPTRKAFIRDTANYILRARASRAEQADPPTVGKKWVDRFIKRHKYDIVPSHVLDANRQASEDPEAINAWFLKYKAVVAEHGIVADDIWNMDETGFQIGVGKDQMVVTKRRRAHYFSLPTNRESATAVEAISATGRVIPVFLILSGTMHMANWYRLEELDKDTVIGTSPTGYSNDELSMAWIQHFEAYTKKGAVGSKRLLLMDGYGSHCTREFIQYCDDSSIVPFGFPPHSTHLLQPLDVVMFQPLKHYHAEALDLIVRDGCANITKIEFLSVIQEVRRKAFREDSILSAFKKSGLVPYDPLVVMRRIQERQERALTPPPPPAPELQSSPFNTPVTLRQLKKIAYDLQTQAKEEDFNPALKRTLDQFVRGALTQGTELLYTMRDLKRTKMAEEVTRRRRSQKNQQLKAGGVLTVDHARKIVRQKDDDALEKARKIVERADAQMRNMYKKWFGEAAKVARKYRLDGRLEPLYIVDQEGKGRFLRRG
ncbi:hypothetical protein HIM_10841 [Hirsutella minnesotensis 3608]|uniref:HTH CENPB-type domain-containing protein n=3 Tax=Hirsutella minnesotensis 3608 TaxID=1043627 RepID=A0A0F7ZRK2_9HYPO|nr:hypothetical protein HIM_10841 [Hirsutella minnesotensis 3608]